MSTQQPSWCDHRQPPCSMRSLSLTIHTIPEPKIRVSLKAEFHYAVADPLTVLVELHASPSDVVSWVISRDLLYDGTTEPSGLGDVRLWPSVSGTRRVMYMKLEAHGTSCLLEMDSEPLEKWLLETFALVHPGTELCDVDWHAVTAGLMSD